MLTYEVYKFTTTEIAAENIAKKFGGNLSNLKNGYKIDIPYGKKGITIRIMNEGSGGRSQPYFRVSIPDKSSLNLNGKLTNNPIETHIDMSDNYIKQINEMITKYKEGK